MENVIVGFRCGKSRCGAQMWTIVLWRSDVENFIVRQTADRRQSTHKLNFFLSMIRNDRRKGGQSTLTYCHGPTLKKRRGAPNKILKLNKNIGPGFGSYEEILLW